MTFEQGVEGEAGERQVVILEDGGPSMERESEGEASRRPVWWQWQRGEGRREREFGESWGLDPTGPCGQQGCLTFSLSDMRAIAGF